MTLCCCCKDRGNQNQQTTNLILTNSPASTSSNPTLQVPDSSSSDLNLHICCSEERRKDLKEKKARHFPKNDTFWGTLLFKDETRQSLAECIYIHHTDIKDGAELNEDKLEALYKLMTETWKIPPPDHMVSVIGGGKDFGVDKGILNGFKDTIRKISRGSRTWFITGGTHTGVMKQVSAALKDEPNPICIGIPVFGRLEGRDDLIEQSKTNSDSNKILYYKIGSSMETEDAYIDSSHSHLILYDDGQEKKYGGEKYFRTALENYIIKKTGCPYALVVFNGGNGTFETIYKNVKHDHKIVLVNGSRGVTDRLAKEMEIGSSGISQIMKDYMNKILVDDYERKLKECKSEEKKDLFLIAEKDGQKDINTVLMKALMPTLSGKRADRLRLALLWQEPSLLKEYFPIKGHSNETLSKDLENLLVLALARGNVAFVKILLYDYEVAIKNVVRIDVLKLLYGYQSHEKNFPTKYLGIKENPPAKYSCLVPAKSNKLTKRKKLHYEELSLEKLEPDLKMLTKYVYQFNKNHSFAKGNLLFSEDGITKVRKKFLNVRRKKQKLNESIQNHPLWELFVWSAACNLPDIAKVLWPLGKDQLGKALMSSRYFQKVADGYERLAFNDHHIDSCRENQTAFSKLASQLLDECYKRNKESSSVITTQKLHLPECSKTNLELAVMYRNHDFVAHTSVQNILTDVWAGKLDIRQISNKRGYLLVLLAIFFPLFIPLLKFNRNEIDDDKIVESASKCVQRCLPKSILVCSYKIRHFYSAPVVSFLLNFVFHIGFVVVYSHALVVEGRKMDVEFSYECVLLYAMVVGFVTVELHQISQYEGKSILMKLKRWIADYQSHNFWDIFNLVFFLTAVTLNVVLYKENGICQRQFGVTKTICTIPHILHSANCAIWILRVTTALRFSTKFGQLYEMVKLMFADLPGFIIALVIMVMAYGVFSTCVHFPNGEAANMNKRLLSFVIIPWFHIYGEYFLDVDRTNPIASSFIQNKKSAKYEDYIQLIALGVYLCITNIVLLNIIIAAFNNTYTKVITEGTKIWKYNMYHVVVEYMNRCTSPPPFCVIQHIFLFLRWIIKRGPKDATHKSTSDKFNSKMSVDPSDLSEAERIVLSRFQCDCALHIFNKHMEIVNGKIAMRDLNLQDNESVDCDHQDSGVAELTRIMKDQGDQIKNLSDQLEEQRKIMEEHMRDTREQRNMMDEQNKMMEEQRKIMEEQRKMMEVQKKIMEEQTKI